MISSKTASLVTLAFLLLLFITPAVLVYVIDPYRIYHDRWIFKQARYDDKERYQYAGWINTTLSDPIENVTGLVVGSSTTADYTDEIINKNLPWGKTMNLAVQGATPYITATVARRALAKGEKIRHLLWDIHFLYGLEADYEAENNYFPYYLYNSTPLDDGPYLYNIINLTTAFDFFKGDFTQFSAAPDNHGPFRTALFSDAQAASKRFDAFKSPEYRKTEMLPLLQEHQLKPLDLASRQALTYPSVDKNLLEIILPLCNQDIDIVIFMGPTTQFFYASNTDTSFLYKLVYMRRYILEQTRSCNNIRLFGFDNVDNITANLDNYADDFHYATPVNHYILNAIAHNKHQLTLDTIDEYEAGFMQRINDYPKLFKAHLTP